MNGALVLLAVLFVSMSARGAAGRESVAPRVRIPAGKFRPLFGVPEKGLEYGVVSFSIDRYPVTRREYGAFIKGHSEWRKDKRISLYADANYLSDWTAERYPAGTAEFPVVNVSWFAASAFCEARGGRLPTVLEWEYVAAASALRANAASDPGFAKEILAWYSKPSHGRLRAVGQSSPNFYGVHDMHQLVWEWTGDFNSVFLSGDNRQDGDKSDSAVCGAGATGASNREDYAAFMRYAMRSSLKAEFAQGNVGFRCAYD